MKVIWMLLGFLFCALGVVGVYLPLVPTVPLFLLAAFFFGRGSKRFHGWLINTSYYKNNLESFSNSRAMAKKTKIRILCISTPMILLGIFTSGNLYIQGVLVAAMIFKYYYFIFRIKTLSAVASK